MSDVYVVDTHAFAAYLTDSLPIKSDRIFKANEAEECRIVIPSIVIAELIYVFEKTGTKSRIWELFDLLETNPGLSMHALDQEVLKIVPGIELTELHDRIIIATCKLINAKQLITKDEEIRTSRIVTTIW